MSVFRLVLGQALRLVFLGVGAGLVAAGVLTRLLERLLFGVEPLDPWTFAVTAADPARGRDGRVVLARAPRYAHGTRRRVADELVHRHVFVASAIIFLISRKGMPCDAAARSPSASCVAAARRSPITRV